ncbi:MAG: MBL fold metallo-hydrolase [Candidatus Hydrothermarchaeota archaeon]|nr:MAG: MBL fold metallo-hydrolase [Candidatus Hydrothermarchaeota archaeon]
MRVRWLGNSCVEIFGKKHVVIDPNYIVEPKQEIDYLLVTHEHSDHFDLEKLKKLRANNLIAPRFVLKRYGLEGITAEVGKEIEGIKVLESWCWKAVESFSYFYMGVLHPGDSAKFPEVKGVKVVFTACFPDFYPKYVEELKRLKPKLVIPFHYSPKKRSNAEGLKEMLEREKIACRIIEIGEEIEI